MDCTKLYATWWSGNCYHREQLNAIISSTDVKAYAWILHDKCPKEDGSGEVKKPHFHYLVQLTRNQRGSWFKQFNSEDMGIVFFQPVKCAESAYKYLIHDTDKARKEKKFLYDESERVSTIDNFDNPMDEKADENLQHYLDLLELVEGNITWHQFLYKMPKRLHMIGNLHKSFIILYKERHSQWRTYMDHEILREAMDSAKAQWQDPKISDPKNGGMRVLTPQEEEDMPF